MPDVYANVLQYCNIGFTSTFALEAIIKMAGFGFKVGIAQCTTCLCQTEINSLLLVTKFTDSVIQSRNITSSVVLLNEKLRTIKLVLMLRGK